MEDYLTRIANRCISVFLLAAALAAPVVILAAPAANDDGVQVRVYDTHHKDYHNWDDRENHAWGVYLTSKHKKNHEYKESNKREQGNYWSWRHSHPDHD
jgi:hypothetical protein